MSSSAVSVQTELNYHLTPEKGGVNFVFPGTASAYRRTFDTQPTLITDLRSIEHECPASLHVQGFQLLNHTCSEKEWTDAARIKDVAYEETKELLIKAYVPAAHQNKKVQTTHAGPGPAPRESTLFRTSFGATPGSLRKS